MAEDHAPQQAAPQQRRAWRIAMRVLAVLLALSLTAAAGLWWWSGTDGSLATTLQWLQRSQVLNTEGVSGAVRTGGRVERLRWHDGGLLIEAQGLHLSWQPLALLSGQLRIDRLAADVLRIEDQRPAPATPATPPAAIVLPFPVTLAEVSLGRLQWQGATAFEASSISGRYTYNGASHHLLLRTLQANGGSYHGEARLQAGDALQLEATVVGALQAQLPAGGQPVPLAFEAQARGPLQDLRVRAQLRATAQTTTATQASLSARLTPWAAQPLPEAQARFADLDLALLWPQGPHTRLTGEASVRSATATTASWEWRLQASNALPGPWDLGRLPLERVAGNGQWRDGMLLLRQLQAQLAGGRLQAQGRWTEDARSDGRWQLNATLNGIAPGQLHRAMAGPRLGGKAALQGTGSVINFDAALQASDSNTAAPGIADALGLRSAQARGRWDGKLLSLPLLQLRAREVSLDGALELRPHERAGQGRMVLVAPGLRATANGQLSQHAGAGQVDAQLADAGRLLRWLQALPGWPVAWRGAQASGSASLGLQWQGGWQDPGMQARLAADGLAWQAAANTVPVQVRSLQAALTGKASNAQLTVRSQLEQKLDKGTRRYSLALAANGGGTLAGGHAALTQLEASAQEPGLGTGTWQVSTLASVPVRWTGTGVPTVEVGAGQAALLAPAGLASGTARAQLAWEPLRWRPGQLASAGRITGLPLAWLELVGGAQLAGMGLAGDLVFDGQWDAALGQTLSLRASLARVRGDVCVMADGAGAGASRIAAGVREARLRLANDGERGQRDRLWDSARAGSAQGRLATRLSRDGAGGWHWAADAPLEGRLRAQLPRVGIWSLLAPPGWRLRGSLAADLALAGSRAAPLLTGTASADDLALRSVVDGIELRDGRLRVRLDGTRLLVDEFSLHGAGDKGGGGTLRAQGQALWEAGAPRLQFEAKLERLRASIRTDRQLTVSGDLAGHYDKAGAAIRGKLRIDQGRIVLPDEDTPKLGEDVAVRRGLTAGTGAKAASQASEAAAPAPRTVTLAVTLEIGEDFQVRGHGLDTRLRGSVELTGQTLALARLNGTVTTEGGQYRAYGQRLDVEHGVLRFTGPPDNPALDILAIRPNMTQRVGVQITGNALLPRVRLYAQPDMPDAEKLAWLVTGRSQASGGAEAALLQEAALALLGSRGGATPGLAASLGLDELSYRGATTGATGSTSEAAVVLGKRFARNFYVTYERSLAGAVGTLSVFYDISRNVTLRGQTGDQSAVDLILTFQYD